MVAINERGEAQMISMISHTVIHTYKFSSAALCVKFSPDGQYFAVSKENMGKLYCITMNHQHKLRFFFSLYI